MTALSLAPYSGLIEGKAALNLMTAPAATAEDRIKARKLARIALIAEPTAVAAAVALGLDEAASGNVNIARRNFSFVERLSRRDLTTQLWWIEDAVGRGNFNEALKHYDIAMRTTPQSWETLFPILNSASRDPAIRKALISMLVAHPIWGDQFIAYASRQQADPLATAALLRGVAQAGGRVPSDAHARALSMLIDMKHQDDAWNYYTQLHPGADRSKSRDPSFRGGYESSTLFDWVLIPDTGASSTIGGGIFDFALPPSVGGPLLRQYELLPPGRYKLTGRAVDIDQPLQSSPYWTLVCRGGAELGRIDVSGSGRFSGRITVPTGCPIQILTLVARPSESITGLSGRIERALLEPIP